mgnify:CR=1 FL=1
MGDVFQECDSCEFKKRDWEEFPCRECYDDCWPQNFLQAKVTCPPADEEWPSPENDTP